MTWHLDWLKMLAILCDKIQIWKWGQFFDVGSIFYSRYGQASASACPATLVAPKLSGFCSPISILLFDYFSFHPLLSGFTWKWNVEHNACRWYFCSFILRILKSWRAWSQGEMWIVKILVFLSLYSRYGCGASSSGFPAALAEAFGRPLAAPARSQSMPHTDPGPRFRGWWLWTLCDTPRPVGVAKADTHIWQNFCWI